MLSIDTKKNTEEFKAYLEKSRKDNEIARFSLDAETHRSRRNLLVVSFIGVLLAFLSPHVTKISLFGVEFSNVNIAKIIFIIVVVIVYEVFIFISRCYKDYAQWKTKTPITKLDNMITKSPVNKEIEIYVLEIIKSYTRPDQPGYIDLTKEKMTLIESSQFITDALSRYWGLTAFHSKYTRIHFWFFEFGLPLVLAIIVLLIGFNIYFN